MFNNYLVIYIKKLKQLSEYKKYKKKKSFEEYVLNHMEISYNVYHKEDKEDKFNKRISSFIEIKKYYPNNEYYNNEEYHKKLLKFMKKKIKFSNIKIKDTYLNKEFYNLTSLWQSQIFFCFTNAMQNNGFTSLVIINTLESLFRIIAKDNDIDILKIKNNKLYDLENNDSLTTVLEKLNNNNMIHKYRFIYDIIVKKNLRHDYCHGNVKNFNNEELAYIILMFIYILFIRKNNKDENKK